MSGFDTNTLLRGLIQGAGTGLGALAGPTGAAIGSQVGGSVGQAAFGPKAEQAAMPPQPHPGGPGGNVDPRSGVALQNIQALRQRLIQEQQERQQAVLQLMAMMGIPMQGRQGQVEIGDPTVIPGAPNGQAFGPAGNSIGGNVSGFFGRR